MIPSASWELWEWNEVLSSYLADCQDDDLLEDVWTSLRLLQEYGNLCPSVVSEALGHGYKLFSLKARAKKIRVRMIYFFSSHPRRIIFVDVFEKKKGAIEAADLKSALKRKSEIEAGAPSALPIKDQPRIISASKG